MNEPKVYFADGYLFVVVDYVHRFGDAAANLGGQWDNGHGAWRFPPSKAGDVSAALVSNAAD